MYVCIYLNFRKRRACIAYSPVRLLLWQCASELALRWVAWKRRSTGTTGALQLKGLSVISDGGNNAGFWLEHDVVIKNRR